MGDDEDAPIEGGEQDLEEAPDPGPIGGCPEQVAPTGHQVVREVGRLRRQGYGQAADEIGHKLGRLREMRASDVA